MQVINVSINLGIAFEPKPEPKYSPTLEWIYFRRKIPTMVATADYEQLLFANGKVISSQRCHVEITDRVLVAI